jgi:hypothetical protein
VLLPLPAGSDFFIEDNITPVSREGQQAFRKFFDYLDLSDYK